MCIAKIQTQEFFTPLKDVPKQQLSRVLNLKFSILASAPLTNINCVDEITSNSDGEVSCPPLLDDYCTCLLDISDFTRSGGSVPAVCYSSIFDMFETNIGRQIPLRKFNQPSYDAEEDEEPFFDLAWFYLQYLYDFFVKLIDSPGLNASVFEQLVTERLMNRILRTFNNQDVRERDYLRLLLHKIYGKFVKIRLFVRKSIGHIFTNYAYSDESFYGIEELLAVLVSIINGFALPLKEAHKDYLEQQIMPLHRPNSIFSYYRQLTNCVTQFIQKDPRLVSLVITTLFKYWPRANSAKELLLLNELDDVLNRSTDVHVSCVMEPLFRKLGFLFQSPHFQISERAMLFFNNECFLKLVADNAALAIPTFLPKIQNALHHWNISIRTLAESVTEILRTIDQQMYDYCLDEYANSKKEDADRKETIKHKWEMVEQVARQSPLYEKYKSL